MAKKENEKSNNLMLFDTVQKMIPYHNDFANAVFTNFSRKEKQLLLILIAGIKESDSDNHIYHFNPKEIKALLNMEKQEYSILVNLIYSLQKKPIGIFSAPDEIRTISIFDQVIYKLYDPSIKVSFGKSATMLFKKLKGNFSKYFLDNITNLERENSIEFYLRAESSLFKGGNFYLDSEVFSKIFNTNYKTTSEIRRKLIDICVDDINKNTDINMVCSNIKNGRKIIGFSFTVTRQLEYSENLKSKIEKIKKNIYVSRSGFFKKDNLDKTIHTLLRKFSLEKLITGLDLCYESIKKDFNSLSYLENAIDYALKNNLKSKKIVQNILLEQEDVNSNNIEIIDKNDNNKNDFYFFEKLSEKEKSKIEKVALELFVEKNKDQGNFIATIKKRSPTMYYNSLKDYILQAMKMKIEEVEIIEKNSNDGNELKIENNKTLKKRGRRKKLDMLDELDKEEEVSKNEKKILSYVKKIYGKSKFDEIGILKNNEKIEVFWIYYIELLKFNEKNKINKT